MERGTVIKVAEGKYPFHFWIQKAVASEEMGKMVVEGVASTPNVDHDHERMAPEALKAMANIINTTGVPLRVEHSQNDNAVIGNVNKAWIDERNNLWIKAVLDEAHPAAGILYKGLKDGVKMGLSVGGYVKRATQELVEGVGKMVNTFYDVLLDEVSVTQKPSNYDARLMAKSFAKSEGDVDALAGALERNEFLFYNAMGAESYLQAISKSVKESDWQDISKDNLMDKKKSMDDKETEKTTKAEEKEEDKTTKATEKEEEKTTKASEKDEPVTKGQFNELVKAVGEMGNAFTEVLGKMVKAMENSPVDQRQPEEKKKDPEEGKNVNKADGGAKDGEQPDQKKDDPEAGKNVGKTADNGTDEDGEREKSRKEKGDKEDTYDLETVERAIKTIQNVTKGMDDSEEKKTTKAEESKSEDTETRKSIKVNDMDAFVISVADYIERVEKRMKDGGYQTEHIAKTLINGLRSNPEMRKSINEFMTQPGQKRSVVNGTPFVKMKDGRTFALTLTDSATRTEKSVTDDQPKSFKAMWGSRFSSTPQSE